MTDVPADDEIAADDAGGGALGRNVGETAGGQESFGVGSKGPAGAAEGQGAKEIAADDAGATVAAAERWRREEHRRD